MRGSFSFADAIVHSPGKPGIELQQRFTDADMAGAGFETLKFHAANVIWDEQAISDEMWFWNPAYLFWGTLPEQVGTFEVDPFEPLQDQVGKRSLIWTMGNYVCTNRRRLGALDGRTA